jgi:hypothetical protein
MLLVCVVGIAAGALLYQRYSLAEQGQRDFARLGCTGCHFSGAGPNLMHVVRKHDEKLLTQFILDPESVYRERQMQPLNAGYMLMPSLNPTQQETRAIIAYFRELDRN